MTKSFIKTLPLCLGVLVVAFFLTYLASAWTEPTQAPPGGNVDTPLNVGRIGQYKIGGLILNVNGADKGLMVLGEHKDPVDETCPTGYDWYDLNGNKSVDSDECINTVLTVATDTIAANNNRITQVATPIDGKDAVNKDYVDAASGGSGGMPLQGNIIFHDQPANPYVNTVPLSLPKSGCSIKITACDPAPIKLIIGADPVARTPKQVSSASIGPTITGIPPIGATNNGGGTFCYWRYIAHDYEWGYDIGENMYCHPGEWCTSNICCPNSYQNYICGLCTNVKCSGTAYPNEDCTHGNYCYKLLSNGTRCNDAGVNEVLIGYNDSEYTCIYCPSSHPKYDPTAKSCITDAQVSTIAVGTYCSTLSTTLTTGFTDLTFLDGSSNPAYTRYIAVSYSCPQ